MSTSCVVIVYSLCGGYWVMKSTDFLHLIKDIGESIDDGFKSCSSIELSQLASQSSPHYFRLFFRSHVHLFDFFSLPSDFPISPGMFQNSLGCLGKLCLDISVFGAKFTDYLNQRKCIKNLHTRFSKTAEKPLFDFPVKTVQWVVITYRSVLFFSVYFILK